MSIMYNSINKLLIILLITVSFPLNTWAADQDKNFAVKGLAAMSCATFVQEREKLSLTYAKSMSWLTGFISAYNYLSPDTYDVAPWQNVDLFSTLLASHCAKNPQESFFIATNKLINSIKKDRLQTISETVTISIGDHKMTMYKDMIFRIQTSLKDKGYLKARWPTGNYDASTIAAMKEFQAKNKIETSGVPGPQSLYVLFSK